MTASPIATPLPGTDPGNEVADVHAPLAGEGSGGAVDGSTRQPSRSRRRKVFLLLFLVTGFAALLGVAAWYLLFRQPLPVPGLPGEVVMPGYSTAVYGANRPMGLAVTPDGSRIYVGATEGDRVVRIYDASGAELGELLPPVSTGTEHVPVYLAADPINGDIYVTDRPTGDIYVFGADGTYLRAFDPGAEQENWQPLGIAFDAAGTLYVSDVSVSPQRILAFDRSGALVRTLGTGAGLNFPNGIAVDEAGFVYVTDSNNGRLLVVDAQDQVVAQVGRGVGDGNLGLPRGVVVSDGRVYIADATGQGVFVYGTYTAGASGLEFLGFFGGAGVANGAFQYPNGITVDGRGRVYVTDGGNDRIQVWSY